MLKTKLGLTQRKSQRLYHSLPNLSISDCLPNTLPAHSPMTFIHRGGFYQAIIKLLLNLPECKRLEHCGDSTINRPRLSVRTWNSLFLSWICVWKRQIVEMMTAKAIELHAYCFQTDRQQEAHWVEPSLPTIALYSHIVSATLGSLNRNCSYLTTPQTTLKLL